MTPRRLAAGLGAVIVAGAGAAGMAAWHPWPRTGADRIEHAVQWRGDCASISTTSPALAPEARRWRRATTTAAVSCEFLGPFVIWAQFADRAALRADVLDHPSAAPACIAGREIVLSYLDDQSRFAAMCRRIDGAVIDVVSPPPDILTDLQEHRDRNAQLAALRRFFGAQAG